MAFRGTSLEIIIIFLNHSLEQMFHQNHAYYQPPECGKISMKVSKPTHIIIPQAYPIYFYFSKQRKYLATKTFVSITC